MKIQKFEYFEKKKSSSDDIKSIFHNFLRAIFWEKKENQRTQVLHKKLDEAPIFPGLTFHEKLFTIWILMSHLPETSQPCCK